MLRKFNTLAKLADDISSLDTLMDTDEETLQTYFKNLTEVYDFLSKFRVWISHSSKSRLMYKYLAIAQLKGMCLLQIQRDLMSLSVAAKKDTRDYNSFEMFSKFYSDLEHKMYPVDNSTSSLAGWKIQIEDTWPDESQKWYNP